MTDTTDTCSICYGTYTATLRRPTPCSVCDFRACSVCTKRHLTTTTADPHCPACKSAWHREHLDTHLTRSWCEGEYRRHRADLLFDRERSLLPATQGAVAIELQKRKAAEELVPLAERQVALMKELDDVNAEVARLRYFIKHGRHEGAEESPKERRQFIAACPDADCRGFLTTAYVCGTCNRKFCADCREARTDDHVCNPDLVATIKAIAADSRPCPKCGMAISRVSGCDQMYCTSCDTPFSWTTGKEVTNSVIHNPHYFERMRRLGKEIPAAAVVGAGGACANGWPRTFPTLFFTSRYQQARTLYQAARHVEQVVLPSMPVESQPTDNTDLRVKYLLKDIDETKFKQMLQRRERRRAFLLELRGPHELFVALMRDAMIALIVPLSVDTTPTEMEMLKNLELFVNAPLRAIGDRYRLTVPQISTTVAGLESAYIAQGYKPSATKSDDATSTSSGLA